ncbi:hypothetical protein DUY81_01540 [Acidipropionibacterium acidipropionici]|jgi:hypothetical protein|uniref:Uncharacterized protein n=1 Tax=Acidipropionibacterium acidipropionici TaxID=1748 RepID=A0ABN4U396_9ACTN|nr:DUF6226 family protein [Acidipropionibacterium acidipropionici]AOZ47223.1 hypothetical protein A8L58_11640 [Acidipropionibacterium acidipropionici]AZP36669.1 hypothetical protein DUY81_01540 [Acidipropionibacterium acidipropionici]
MRTIDEVRRAVDAAFAEFDAPSWPDPHQGRRVTEAEYGRFTDPERYRVLSLRLKAWSQVLSDQFGITVDHDVPQHTWAPADVDDPTTVSATTTAWRSPRPGALALRVTTMDVDGQTFIEIGIDADPVDFAIIPECGCDACDPGSADLLTQLDDVIASAALGDLTVVIGPRSTHPDADPDRADPTFLIVGTGSGWFFDGDDPAEPAEIIDAVRSGDDPHLPEDCTIHHGGGWLS